MSIFIVDPAHIDAILSTAINGPADDHRGHGLSWQPPYVSELLESPAAGSLSRETIDRAGRALLRECVASVSHHYEEALGELPGPCPNPDPERYEWTDLGQLLSAIECCKAIACYEYQSCEHLDWEGCGARSFCERLRHSLIGSMEGYEEAPWEWTPDLLADRAPGFPPSIR